jgi:hypothetical protein
MKNQTETITEARRIIIRGFLHSRDAGQDDIRVFRYYFAG